MKTKPQDLLFRLFEYIGEQAKEIDPRAYQISKNAGFRCDPSGVAGLPGTELDVRAEGDHIWLRFARLEADSPPNVPESYRELFRISSDPLGPLPELEEAGLAHRLNVTAKGKTKEERVQLESNLRSAALQALQGYTDLWKSWAEGEKPRRKTISLYADLFALKHQMEAEETAKPTELIWGMGIATWQMNFDDKPFSFTYPLLTQTVEIALDEQTMALEVRSRATDTRLELEAFIACGVVGAASVERTAKEHLVRGKERPVTPFDPGSYSDVLKLVATNLDSKGTYSEILANRSPVPVAGEHLVVTDAWVLLSRPRTHNYLIDDLKRLQDQIAAGCDIPAGPLALVLPPSDESVEHTPINFRGLSSRGDYTSEQQPQELYFPLPYNNEQVTIVQRLEHAPGIAVQGPPGTGKTHTIANIICHYLATGRRVLVTSRGEPALQVLQSKIPEEVQPLTVALLTSDRAGIRQFQASIEAIQHRVSQLQIEQTREEIATHKHAIDRAHAELESIDRRIDEIAMAQLSEVDVDGSSMRAQKLAELVVAGRDQHGWFDDQLSLSSEHVPPLSEDDVGRLREYRRKLGADIAYIQANIPSADDLPTAANIAELHNVLCRIKELNDLEQSGKLIPLKALTHDVLQAARHFLQQLDEAKALVDELDAVGESWPHELRAKCRLSSFTSERKALEALFDDIDRLIAARAEFLKRPVEFPDAGLVCVKTKEAVNRAVSTGKPFGFIAIGVGDAKQHLAAVKVAGLSPNGTNDWEHIQRYVALHEQVISFLARWNQFAETFSMPRLNGGVASLRHIELIATTVRTAHRLASHYDLTLPKQAESVFARALTKELTGSATDLAIVREHLVRHLTRAELAQAATNLSTLQEKLAGRTGDISNTLHHFIQHELGNPAWESNRVAAKFAELTSELRRLAGLAVELSTVHEYANRFERTDAVKLASRIRSIPVTQSGEDSVFPPTWRQAWNWARIKSHLDSIEAREELITLSARRRDLEIGLARLYKAMVAKAAWLATKRNATPKVLQALAGYATAIRRIGQGTGPNAIRYRRDAREAMLDAAGAVPCWIMSHAKISESMPADIGAFDLVIVDEASQSDLWALPAIVRGKKILIVGDDKQVSPDAGFIASQRIDELKHRFLSDQPYGTEMTPEKSLYDLGARVFAADQVMLREHFRCVPPIIAYSNRTFYKGGIHPLRIPKASERIDPPLVDIYVPQGLRDTHDHNSLEAEAIAEEVSMLLKDDRFAGKTIGVVSLLGMDQAKHIDAIVRARCPAADLLHRKFECGDARTFQGSERDIMFLSMVVSPENCRAISGNMFEQRYNVAASRARDRMYLVRSVKLSDLSEKDLRLTLLSYFDKPFVVDEAEAENLIDRCESGFERQVYSELVKRGYRVIPQVKTGAYRIDMVVEGIGDTRLAIECDGDEYHGPDRWQQDMNRQRVLERAGWTFWRCFASTWSLRRDDVLSELIERLTAMGIEPLGALERAPSLVEKRMWVAATSEETDKVTAVLEEAIASANS